MTSGAYAGESKSSFKQLRASRLDRKWNQQQTGQKNDRCRAVEDAGSGAGVCIVRKYAWQAILRDEQLCATFHR
jgi:hypothetical protein